MVKSFSIIKFSNLHEYLSILGSFLISFITKFNQHVANKKTYSIIEVARMFKTKIKYLPTRKGERYASALINDNLSNKVHKNFGKIKLKEYISNFLLSKKNWF